MIAVYEKHPPAVAEVALLLGHDQNHADAQALTIASIVAPGSAA